ncbi:MAG: N-acetylmuramoyl-L-alanine amidase [Terriglobales bacterium]
MKSWNHVVAIVLTIAALAATTADDKRLSIYTPQSSYAVNVLNRDGHEYVPLLDVLVSLGSAGAYQDGDKWKLKFSESESEFKAGKTKAKVNRKNVQLSAPFVIENGRGLVPLHSLGLVLSRLMAATVDFREPARRVFIGGAATHFTAELQPAGAKLVLHFSAPVNPAIATEPGKLHMIFSREPVVAPAGTQAFDDKVIRAANFSEHDGVAELLIHTGAPVLATFSDQNRTITIAPVPQVRAPAVAASPPSAAPSPPSPTSPTVPAPAQVAPEAAQVAHPRATVVIDPGHGGDDRGAALSATLAEKDVTLAWARRLRAALDQKGIPATLLRDADNALTSDQRAAIANAARPLVFITLHAGTTGSGVRVYTAHLGESAPRAGSFLPWDTAQSAFLDGSRALAGSVVAEITKRAIPVATAPVMLRPLNNIAASAIAIEIMPPATDVAGLTSVAYQQTVCAAIAEGVAGSTKPVVSRAGAAGGWR